MVDPVFSGPLSGVPVMQLEIRNAVERDRLIYNAFGFAAGCLIAIAFFRRVSLPMLSDTFRSTMRSTGMVMLVILAAFLMNFVIALLGIRSIVETPGVLAAVNPLYALSFALERPGVTLVALGAVFLCVTGAEALYADMGHFGRDAIQLAWLGLVFPALALNYLG